MPKIKLCFAQTNPVRESPEKNLKTAFLLAEEAADAGSDMIIFPEQSATGWNPASQEYLSDENGFIPESFRKAAAENNIAVLGSFREISNDKPKNTAVFYDNCGNLLAKYSKIHLFNPGGENKCFSCGNKPSAFTYMGVKFGLAICYDLRFSEIFTYYAKEGCECVIVQASWPDARMKHWNLFIHSRAVENQYYVAGVNPTGLTDVEIYSGGSVLASPFGDTVMQAGDKPGLFYAEIDTSLVYEARKSLHSLSDRRDDLYIGWHRK